MIGKLHIYFAKHLLDRCSLPEQYILWSNIADSDLYYYHRLTTHRISNFNSVYNLAIQQHDMRKALNENIAYFIHISHLYLDSLTGPLKTIDGWNITSHHGLFDLFKKYGYIKTINKIYSSIEHPSDEYIVSMCSLIDSLNINNRLAIFDVMMNRILEETIGTVNYEPLYNENISNKEYTHHYQEFLRFEEKAFLYLEYL